MATTDAERVFVDTNVLLAATDRSRARHADSLAFLEDAAGGRTRLFASGQVVREYLVVATRPVARNGLGMVPSVACTNVAVFRRVVRILDEVESVAARLVMLVEAHQLQGTRIHDASLVATMDAHGLTHLKTWNPRDFRAFPHIRLV